MQSRVITTPRGAVHLNNAPPHFTEVTTPFAYPDVALTSASVF
jgi:hypothetical protein